MIQLRVQHDRLLQDVRQRNEIVMGLQFKLANWQTELDHLRGESHVVPPDLPPPSYVSDHSPRRVKTLNRPDRPEHIVVVETSSSHVMTPMPTPNDASASPSLLLRMEQDLKLSPGESEFQLEFLDAEGE